MATLMGDALRFKYVEHPSTMLLGAVLITVGNAKSKARRICCGQSEIYCRLVRNRAALIAFAFHGEPFFKAP